MITDYIRITNLNDFLFCPKSLYFHNVYEGVDSSTYKEVTQYAGSHAHKNIDEQKYSTRKDILQSYDVCSHEYELTGVIDIFDIKTGILRERKKAIKRVYKGYMYQCYAQYLCLMEMGYTVKKIYLYAKDTNEKYLVPLPDEKELDEFTLFLEKCKKFDPMDTTFTQNANKCAHCIYRDLCDTYLTEKMMDE